jgi:hypothetical protein
VTASDVVGRTLTLEMGRGVLVEGTVVGPCPHTPGYMEIAAGGQFRTVRPVGVLLRHFELAEVAQGRSSHPQDLSGPAESRHEAEAQTEGGTMTVAAPEKPAKAKKASWKDLSRAKRRDFLLAHKTIPDAAWTEEKRLDGEDREAFIRRMHAAS